jgi:hypothetical protein
MSSHVGPVIIGVFPKEKEAVPENLGSQQAPSSEDPNFSFEQGKPWCK